MDGKMQFFKCDLTHLIRRGVIPPQFLSDHFYMLAAVKEPLAPTLTLKKRVHEFMEAQYKSLLNAGILDSVPNCLPVVIQLWESYRPGLAGWALNTEEN